VRRRLVVGLLVALAGLVVPASASAGWRGLVTGLNETNPWLITPAADVPPAFAPYRDAAAALHPRYFRLNLQWSKLQPTADAPPNFDQPVDGCERGQPPCAPYGGLRALLRAVRARQLADDGWRVVVTIYGTPSWAVAADAPPGDCIRSPTARAPDPAAYEEFVRSVVRLGQEEDVRLAYWSPWNEPNHPLFLGPQRAGCTLEGARLMPAVYAGLVRAMIEARGTSSGLILGEMASLKTDKADSTSVVSFIGDLPDDVVCSAAVWAQHAYVPNSAGSPGAPPASSDLIDMVSTALAAHNCPNVPQLWLTETAVGAPHTNEPRPTDPARQLAECRAIEAAMRSWADDRRVDAAFQYTFREDPVFRVGLADTGLTRLYSGYPVWKAWGGASGSGDPVPSELCAG
jgi:hypothetical protein